MSINWLQAVAGAVLALLLGELSLEIGLAFPLRQFLKCISGKTLRSFREAKQTIAQRALESLLGPDWKATAEHLLAIGFFSKGKKGARKYSRFPFSIGTE
jgi:hypothetical protein